MGAPTYKIRNRDASMLMNYGFSKFESNHFIKKDENLKKVKLGKSEDKFFMAKAADDLKIVVERGSKGKITKKCVVNLDKRHYNKGETVGFCEVYNNGKLIGKVEIDRKSVV